MNLSFFTLLLLLVCCGVLCRIGEAGVECCSVGLGSTPTASQPSSLMKHITELHPGNYVFYGLNWLTVYLFQRALWNRCCADLQSEGHWFDSHPFLFCREAPNKPLTIMPLLPSCIIDYRRTRRGKQTHRATAVGICSVSAMMLRKATTFPLWKEDY